MAKFFGKVGYVGVSVELRPGVWAQEPYSKNYRGDVIQNIRRLESGESINDNVVVNNTISVLADSFAFDNFHSIRYVEWMGGLWKVTSVRVERPRLILTLGGIYNGETA